jgi:UDP-2,3-diacylglucosamine pyrophosphatase LpxH
MEFTVFNSRGKFKERKYNMSRILFIGDPHLRINHFEQAKVFLKWVGEMVILHKPDIVCNLGDTMHNHAVLRSELMKEFRDHINIIVNCGSDYWYVLGNHDQWKPRDSKYHALQTFEGMKGLTIFDKITQLPQHNITVVPYVQKFEDFPLNAKGLLITHNTFIGADYGFKREDCGINADKSNADLIISGHIHKRQQFGKVIYPGTPYAHNATDVDQTKGLLLFDTGSFKQTFIESPFPKWRSLEFEISPALDIATLHAALENSLNITDKWILKVAGPKAELSAYFKSKQYFKLISDKNVIVKTNPTDSEKAKRVQIESSTPADIISEYIKKVYSGGADKSLIIHKAQEIIKNIQ